MKRIVKIFLHYLLGILGIILISCVPAIFSKVTSWSSSTYWEALKSIFTAIFHPTKWEISYQGSAEVFHVSLADFITGPYFYSMKIIVASLLISALIAYLLVIATFRGPKWLRRGLSGFLSILQAFPDFSFIFLYFPYSNDRRLHISTNRRVHLELLQLKRRANLCSTNRLLVHHTNRALLQNDDAPYGK